MMSNKTKTALRELDRDYNCSVIDKWQFWHSVFQLYFRRRCTIKDIALNTYGNEDLVWMRMLDCRGHHTKAELATLKSQPVKRFGGAE